MCLVVKIGLGGNFLKRILRVSLTSSGAVWQPLGRPWGNLGALQAAYSSRKALIVNKSFVGVTNRKAMLLDKVMMETTVGDQSVRWQVREVLLCQKRF
jgi:hypothetical protein